MKKELLFASAQYIAPATGNNGNKTIYSRIALHPGQLRLLFLVLSILMVTCSTGWANYNPSFGLSPQSHFFATYRYKPLTHNTGVNNIINPFLPISKNNKQLFTDVTLLITNDFYTDFDVMLYNTVLDQYWLVNISPSTYQEELTVPEGTYDITFWPNDMGRNHHYYSVACGPSGGGIGTKFFYGVSITSAMYCNYINIE
jgi:hypothetical protein